MILTVCGIFILTFAAGYFAGGLFKAKKKKKTAERKRQQPALPPKDNRPERLN